MSLGQMSQPPSVSSSKYDIEDVDEDYVADWSVGDACVAKFKAEYWHRYSLNWQVLRISF